MLNELGFLLSLARPVACLWISEYLCSLLLKVSTSFLFSLEFDPEDCPPDCSKPCEKVCPADAILLERVMIEEEHSQSDPSCGKLEGGVITERCYGCGRCLSVCPYDRISEH
jgi:Fe-S-cluster-containing hydrogenase component 2